MRRLFPFLTVLAAAFFFCGMEVMQHGEEIGTLQDQAAQQNDIKKISKEHEAALRKAAEALKAGQIQAGMSSKQLQQKFGAPAAVSPEGDGQRWLYRSVQGRFLDRPWVFFYFDKNLNLLRWECGHLAGCQD